MKNILPKNNLSIMIDNGLFIMAALLFFAGLLLEIPTITTILTSGYGSVSEYGNVGSYIGGIVGSLWSFSGIILFFIAIRLQRKELELQINELKETKETFQQQSFETTFFNLLNRQQQIVNSVEHHYPNKSQSVYDLNQEGVRFFVNSKILLKALYDYFRNTNSLSQEHNKLNINSSDITEEELNRLESKLSKLDSEEKYVQELYLFFMDKYYQQFGHYMRHLYNILRYVNSVKVNFPQEKIQQYISILKSQLSTSELFFIFYNGYAFPKMRAMINEFRITEYLKNSELLSSSHDDFYTIKTTKSWH